MGACNSKISTGQQLQFTQNKIVDANTITQLLRTKIPKDNGEPNIIVWDSKYCLLPINTLKTFLQHDDTNRFQYKNESFDCDDFALVLSSEYKRACGNINLSGAGTFGIITGMLPIQKDGKWSLVGHAMNIYIDYDMDIYIVEPQTDKTTSLDLFLTQSGLTPNFWNVIL